GEGQSPRGGPRRPHAGIRRGDQGRECRRTSGGGRAGAARAGRARHGQGGGAQAGRGGRPKAALDPSVAGYAWNVAVATWGAASRAMASIKPDRVVFFLSRTS